MELIFEERKDGDCLNTNLEHDELVRCHCGKLRCKSCNCHTHNFTFELFDKQMKLQFDGSDTKYAKYDDMPYVEKENLYRVIRSRLYDF